MFEAATGANLYRDSGGAGGSRGREAVHRLEERAGLPVLPRKGYRFSDGEPVSGGELRVRDQALAEPRSGFARRRLSHGSERRLHRRLRGLQRRQCQRRPRREGQRADPHDQARSRRPELLTVLTLPFFQAASSKLSLTQETIAVRQVGDLPTAGAVHLVVQRRPTSGRNIVRNPYYTGTRGRHVDGVELEMALEPQHLLRRDEGQPARHRLPAARPGRRSGAGVRRQPYQAGRHRPLLGQVVAVRVGALVQPPPPVREQPRAPAGRELGARQDRARRHSSPRTP